MDYDKVLVLDAGQIAEYGSPKDLIELSHGKFKAMVEETGAHNAEVLRKMVKK